MINRVDVKKIKATDLIGETFGRLKVLNVHYVLRWGGSHAYAECVCECGNVKDIRVSSLVSGLTTSCGCRLSETWIALGKLNKNKPSSQRKDFGESSFNSLYAQYRKGAKTRNLVFDLSKDSFKKITSSNCYYCGNPPSYIKKQGRGYGEYIYNGVDRINSSAGYTLENCVPCCGICNQAKSDTPQEDFMFWIEKVYNHLKKEN